jgi:hypothetical protein
VFKNCLKKVMTSPRQYNHLKQIMPLNYYTGYDSTLEADLGVHSAEMGLYLEPVKSQGVHQ